MTSLPHAHTLKGDLRFLEKAGGPPSKSLEVAQGTRNIPAKQLSSNDLRDVPEDLKCILGR